MSGDLVVVFLKPILSLQGHVNYSNPIIDTS